MDSAVFKNAAEPRSVDPVWTRIREAAQAAAAAEPVDHSTVPSLESLTGPTLAAPAVVPVPLLAATLIATPRTVIELARAIGPSQPTAPPFSSDARNTPAHSC